jgi:alkylation response protein AidB-like acyl-CoA dehydrogenase/electron transfer flavoprotein alpha subunit/ferredoxin-like protein FixX
MGDTMAAISALRLWKPIAQTLIDPVTYAKWIGNLVPRKPAPVPELAVIMNVAGRKVDAETLPWPVGGLVKRLSPGLACALAGVYSNNDVPAQKKFSKAVKLLVQSFRLTDLIVLPAFALLLFFIALGTALWDAFRFYVLKTPVEKLLAEPVMAYTDAQRKARDLDAVKPPVGLEAKLALNTYRVGSVSHIRTLWPEEIKAQHEMSRAALWWVCPARVYVYDAPLVGRGRVTVNWENCIKCETCWRAEPDRVLWGRFTDHKLIYRPESRAISDLLASLQENAGASAGVNAPPVVDERLWYLDPEITRSIESVLNAAAAFRDAIGRLPAAADSARRAWPAALGQRLTERMKRLEAAFAIDARPDPADVIKSERKNLELRIAEDRFSHALYGVFRLDQKLRAWLPNPPSPPFAKEGKTEVPPLKKRDKGRFPISCEEVSKLFPDRVVKQWEEASMLEEWAEKLRQFVMDHQHPARPAIRTLSSVSPALGFIAACQLHAIRIWKEADREPVPGACAIDADTIEVTETADGAKIKGIVNFVPTTASSSILLVTQDKALLVPFQSGGVAATPMPAIGFRAAGLADIALDCAVRKQDIVPVREFGAHDHGSYLAIALGAGDYLCKRAKEHALGRVQFPGQMFDTEGRDGIAKLGAVKAMIARVESWRLLLETLYLAWPHPSPLTSHASREFDLLCATLAAMAYGPEAGAMAYDAGQVFGGFAYSEDDLLSRFYRDSSLFRFLSPGQVAAQKLHESLAGTSLESAFSRELGTIGKISGKPLDALAARWNAIADRLRNTSSPNNEAPSPFSPLPPGERGRGGGDSALTGEASALLIGVRGLLARVEAGLESGRSMEAEAAAAEVLLGLAEDAVIKARMSEGSGQVLPTAVFPVSPGVNPVALDRSYDTFLARKAPPHRSGAFLVSVFDRSPRYVPEVQLHDPKLRGLWNELVDWFRTNCREKKFNGLHFERYVEKVHDLPEEIVSAVKEKRWLATYIPKTEDGLGWSKAEYYVLNSAAGSFGDAAVCLLIMASTSIGTTPILLGLEDELPRVKEELEPLAKDPKRLGEIGSRIRRIIATFKNPNPAWIRKEFEAVMRLVDSRIRRTRVVKYLSANFLRAFYGAGVAGQRGNFGGFTSGLTRAAELFERIMPDIHGALEELPRRERCHKLFLRSLGHGGVSAFALTEPTAGSDSGGVKTTAMLRSAKLTALPDGRYSFRLDKGDEKSIRYLIDADRIAFNDLGMAYRLPDGSLAQIGHDRYDYATDQGVRSFRHQGNDCEFHDIGQVRQTNNGPTYEYYSLTGAKMWITNGGIATQFCLYAQSPEGVTGFLVDRHAEGLKVGADESKTGQRGSPTNEISLDSVRVPREGVIGYEGHGQVNALETLNVGRCGLAVVSGALMRKLLDEAIRSVPQSAERDRLLGEATAIQFGSESLAYYLIGLFDRPHESVRMESAAAKFICSEDLHEIISLVERAFGPVGQTEKFLLEKARRDARILTIYEGTNEVQRFLVLKDLIALAVDWPELPEKLSERPDDAAAMTLAKWKNRLRAHAKNAAETLGDVSWSDAMLQPALFLLAEMAGEILRLECVYYRLEWLETRKGLLGEDSVDPLLAAGRRAAERTLTRLDHIDGKYGFVWQEVAANRDVPDVRAADAALDLVEEKTGKRPETPGAVTVPFRILSIVRPVADLSPSPRIEDGALRELVWQADPLDRAGLEQALALKAASGPNVTVDVLMPGRSEHEQVIRLLAGAADGLYRLDVDTAALPGTIVEAVRELDTKYRYDLIIAGAHSLDGDRALGPCLAGNLNRPYLAGESVRATCDGNGSEVISFPGVIGIGSPGEPSEPDITTLITSLSKNIQVIGPVRTGRPDTPPKFGKAAGAAVLTRTITTVAGSAEYLKAFAAAVSAATAGDYRGELGKGGLPGDGGTWAILSPLSQKSNLAALRATRSAAELFGREARALITAPERIWPGLLGLARANGMDHALCVSTGAGRLAEEGRREVLRLLISTAGTPMVFAGTDWNEASGFVSGELLASGKDVPLITGATEVTKHPDGYLVLSSPAYEGRLARSGQVGDGAALITMAEEAELPAPAAQEAFRAAVLDLAVKPEWVAPLPLVAEPTLSQADVIITLGYGIRDKAGLELAQELKKKLESMGLSPMFGATRKVTQDLKLLPLEAQIGQTGVRVNPKVVIALGISGAPQHIDYIGSRAEIFCFNKDPEAPLMKLNETRPAPRVHPIPGDLFVTVQELIEKLG